MRYEFWDRLVDPIPGLPGSSTEWEPLVSVDVIGPSGPGQARRYQGLVDTGAAITILPGDAMKPLGIVSSAPYELGAGRSKFPVRIAEVDLTLVSPDGKPLIKHRWTTIVAFSHHHRRGLLGRIGFLDRFAVKFNIHDRFLILTGLTKSARRTFQIRRLALLVQSRRSTRGIGGN